MKFEWRKHEKALYILSGARRFGMFRDGGICLLPEMFCGELLLKFYAKLPKKCILIRYLLQNAF